jgi:hypothetical protein
MNVRDDPRVAPQPSIVEPYLPHRRTAIVLTGTGTDGAYHAGVLRALHEAGVKLDIVAARGVGVVGALFAAIDGTQRLWDDKGLWRSGAARTFYSWRRAPRLTVWALAVSLALVAVPLALAAAGLVVFPIDFVLKMVGIGGAGGLLGMYLRLMQSAFAPEGLPTWLPRIVLLALGGAAIVALVNGWSGGRVTRGAFWWRAVSAPMSSAEIIEQTWRAMWDLVRGATQLKAPRRTELARRYIEMLAENLGQPGFRELLIVVHDVDARRDLVFALVEESRRRTLIRRQTSEAADARRAEVFDLTGVARDHLSDAISAALTVPLATEWHAATFAPDGYWRGETHRLCDRPAALVRLLDELIDLGAEQIVVVAATPPTAGPHALAAARLDGRGRLGDYLHAAEAAIVRDATNTTAGVRIFTIRPGHNPLGPFDFDGGYDDRSQRAQGLSELITRGYEDAYHQFIEPIVGGSGEVQSTVASH